jgi:hypothetical protein
MHVYCVICKEHLGEIEPLEDGVAIEGVCPQCRKKLVEQSQLDEKPMRRIGFRPDDKEPPPK